jgi:FlaA1/EpsC-like NDP-sugar epimerase
LGLGAGGRTRVFLDAIREAGEHKIIGIIDLSESTIGNFRDAVEIPGSEVALEELYQRDNRHVFNSIGEVSDNTLREEMYRRIAQKAFYPSATVSKSASILEQFCWQKRRQS